MATRIKIARISTFAVVVVTFISCSGATSSIDTTAAMMAQAPMISVIHIGVVLAATVSTVCMDIVVVTGANVPSRHALVLY